MKSENFYEMKRCKMDWLDDIYYGTKSSQGTRNAINAIKFVLFDDTSVIPDGLEIGDKYEFISSRKDGKSLLIRFSNIFSKLERVATTPNGSFLRSLSLWNGLFKRCLKAL